MTYRRTILLGLGVGGFSLAACVGPRGPHGGPGGRPGMGGLMAISPNSFARGVTLKGQGEVIEALPYFAQVAGLGFGYEVAQYHLGDCLQRLGDAEADERARAQKYREGAFWIFLSAQSGDVNAQALYAEVLLEGRGVAANRGEAALYVGLAEGSGRADFMHGERQDSLARVRAALSEAELEEGRARAADFDTLVQTQRSLPEMERPQGGPPGRMPGGGRGGPGGGRPPGGGMPGGY